jgi:hypothetical protein
MPPLAPYALVTLAELKAFLPVEDTGQDAQLERSIERASLVVENYLDRRLIYRAPPEVEGSANIVAATAVANGALVVANQPNAAGRTLILTLNDADRSVTAGTVTVTGTVAGVAGVTEVFDLADGPWQHGVKFFTAISGIVVAGLGGTFVGDTLKVGSSVGYVEYHTLRKGVFGVTDLITIERPLRQVLEVNEDLTLTFGTGTRLTVTTDYTLAVSGGVIRRVYANLPRGWYTSYRSVRVTYSAGYAGRANVPADIKYEAMRLAGLLFFEAQQKRIGVSSVSDGTGSTTRFGAASLTAAAQEALAPYMRAEIFGRTGERDFDLEAA